MPKWSLTSEYCTSWVSSQEMFAFYHYWGDNKSRFWLEIGATRKRSLVHLTDYLFDPNKGIDAFNINSLAGPKLRHPCFLKTKIETSAGGIFFASIRIFNFREFFFDSEKRCAVKVGDTVLDKNFGSDFSEVFGQVMRVRPLKMRLEVEIQVKALDSEQLGMQIKDYCELQGVTHNCVVFGVIQKNFRKNVFTYR